ncbi:MAG: GAF domain-containing sensor histidine kinase [Candidatus Heimdallarchaeaceae archaeon]
MNSKLNPKKIKEENIIFTYPEDQKEIIDIDLPEHLIEEWQRLIDAVAKMFKVPAALIMKVSPPYIEVFRSSRTKGNPYHVGEKEHLAGLYCNTVILTKKKLLVPNALSDEIWKDNPDVKLGMVSYLGFPISWPNGQIFGTICVLDSKENAYSKEYEHILERFKEMLDGYLELVYRKNQLENELAIRRKLEETLANQRDYLDLLNKIITHDISNSLSIIAGYVDLLQIEEEQKYIIKKIQGALKTSFMFISKIKNLQEITKKQTTPEKIDEEAIKKITEKYPCEINLHGNCSIFSDVSILSVLDNLIHNSIVHGKTPKIDISIKVEKNQCIIEVKDYGKGIPKEIKDKIFEKGFAYGETGQTGLGLYIVKTVIQQHKGEIIVKDNNPTGAIFIIKIPVNNSVLNP